MAEVLRVKNVVAELRAHQKKRVGDAKDKIVVVVGYTAEYAIFVHERLDLHHDIGQPKFLEQPTRELASTYAVSLSTLLRSGHTIAQAVFIVGLRLQRESQVLVPIDTGALRASAFTKFLENGEAI